MMLGKRYLLLLGAVLCGCFNPSTANRATQIPMGVDGARCNASASFTHITKNDGRRKVLATSDALVFRSNYAVNTDGAPNSYHPDDPYGSEGLAINTICNGANAFTASGRKVNYSQCRSLVALFREAKANGWTSPGKPYMQFYGVSSTQNARKPCINSSGPYEGFFVSSTALIADPSKGICDQDRFLNSLEIPFIITPRNSQLARRGATVGDLAVIHSPKTDKTIFAVVGDVGPKWGLGEGSIAVSKALNSNFEEPTSRKEVYGFGVENVVTVVLTKAGMSPPYSNERITDAAVSAFAEFGGMSRLDACMSEL